MNVYNKIKAFFSKNRYGLKPITELPKAPGNFNIVIDNVLTFAPIFLHFDGKKWIDLEVYINMSDISKIHYYNKPSQNFKLNKNKH